MNKGLPYITFLFTLPVFAVSAQETIYVPVVVHVVYTTAAQNITDGQIHSQLVALNADYQRTNTDAAQTPSIFQSVTASAEIEFYLARVTDDGQETSGITRTQTTHGVFANDDIHFTDLGGKDAWNVAEYLNVWVADLPPEVQGFASTPENAGNTDGVVIDFESFGTVGTAKAPYHLGRTLTHEIGHYLGLKHLWGTTGGCQDDDGIEDTNLQDNAVPVCGSNTSCDSPDMVQNFMNIADDECMNFFTQGQTIAMRGVLMSAREELINDDKGYSAITSVFSLDTESIVLYPNPSYDGRVLLSNTEDISHCLVFDISGKPVLYSLKPANGSWELQLIKKGTYIIQLFGSDYLTTSKITYE